MSLILLHQSRINPSFGFAWSLSLYLGGVPSKSLNTSGKKMIKAVSRDFFLGVGVGWGARVSHSSSLFFLLCPPLYFRIHGSGKKKNGRGGDWHTMKGMPDQENRVGAPGLGDLPFIGTFRTLLCFLNLFEFHRGHLPIP